MIEIRDLRGGHYARIDNEVLDEYELDPYELSIYAHLCRYAHIGSEVCYPSYETLAKKSKMSRSKVITVIHNLITKGLIKKEYQKATSGNYTSNVYCLLNVKSKGVVHEVHYLVHEVHQGVVHEVDPNNTNIINNTNLTRVNTCSYKKERTKPVQYDNFQQSQFTEADYPSMFDNLQSKTHRIRWE